ncbi:LysE family translocator [Pseudomonas congelans]|uniref:LysE family translocator n=1 Tax=Pseudomonas congelans TaxID=200452 RepID=UPI0022A7452F|nr:LysE family translocator [Pseudomonas congelans]
MLTLTQFSSFLIAALLITATPGPDNLMVLGMGIAKGRKSGIVFGLGCAAGCLSHTLLAAIGISTLIAASVTAFTLLKIIGGLYLIWMGINAWRKSGVKDIQAQGLVEKSLPRLFLKGCIANAINPKIVLFFLSFLPQFVIAENGHVGAQIAELGITFTLQAAVLFSVLGYFSGAVGQWLGRRPNASCMLDRLAGTVFIGLGLKLITSR